MKLIAVFIACLLAFASPSAAQVSTLFTLSGQLQDTLSRKPIPDATVSLMNAADSSLVAFTRSDSSGRFMFLKLPKGSYRMSVSHASFTPTWLGFETANIERIDLGLINLSDKTLLTGLTVHAQRPPVEVNGDTLEFNAENFKTKPNAVVEDMLKKMPGVEVDRDGTVRVNGKKINRVLVNGKDFFNGDPKIATRNLAADAIDKVQVFDKLSDQSEFTGVDDGNAEKTINLKMKKDKKNAAFGKATAAAGTDRRYDGQFNINKFNEGQQLSVIGMANNTNRQGFSLMEMMNFTGQSRRMMGGGGGIVINTQSEETGLPVNGLNNSQGITRTIAAGLNYSDSWNKKTDVNLSYFFNDLALANTRLTTRQNILPGNSYNWIQNSENLSRTQSHRVNFSADHKIDSFNSIKLTSVIGYQKGRAANESDYESFVPDGKYLNNGFSNTTNVTEGYNTSNSLLYRHKFKKRSRTFSVSGNMQYNDSRYDGTQQSINNFYDNGSIGLSDSLDQVSALNSVTQSYGANMNYTEPLTRRSLLEFRGFYNINLGELDRTTFDYNNANGKHDVKNDPLSNAFENEYVYAGGGVSIRAQQKKYGYSIGANFQNARLESRLKDSSFSIRQQFTNVLPSANFNYSFTRMKNLRVDYFTSTTPPTPAQLQPVKDISDPLNIREGNPFLKQQYNHNVSIQFFNGNPAKQQNLFAFVNYYATENAIVKDDRVLPGGIRISRPVNANGVYNITGTMERGFSVKELHTRFGIGGNIGYNKGVNFVNDERNETGNFSLAPRVSANYTYKEIVDVNFIARVGYNMARYTLQSALNTNYWRQTYTWEATLNLPGGFTLFNEMNWNIYSGRSDGYNTNVALWNAAISKQVLKSKKGEIKISGFDLLKENIGVDRNANANYVEDIRYQVLQRFFTLGFTYSLQKPMVGGPRAVIRTF